LQRLLALDAPAASSGQESEHVIESFGDFGGRQMRYPRRCELDREGDAVESSADLTYSARVLRRQLEFRANRLRSGLEQAHRFRGLDVVAGRHGKGRYAPRLLALDIESFSARGQESHTRAAEQDAVRQLGNGVEEMLAVVQQNEARPPGEMSEEKFAGRAQRRDCSDVRSPRRADGVGDGAADAVGVGESSQVDEEDAAGILVENLRSDLDGEPCLATTAHAGQRDEPVVRQQLGYLDDLALATDECRALRRKVVRERLERTQRREVAGADLKQSLRLTQVLQAVGAEVRDRHAVRQVSRDQSRRDFRDEDLTAVSGVRDALGFVDVVADVIAVTDEHLTGMQTHAHTDPSFSRPCVFLERS
jgi:hypothetical protein